MVLPSFSTNAVQIIVVLLVAIAILVFKIKFILKMSKAKTDVNVFNNSFALCLLASGCSEKQNLIEIIDKVEKNTKSNWNLIESQLIKYWNDWQAWPQLIKIKISEIISGLGLVFCVPATVYLLGEPHFWVQSKSLVILNTKKL